MVTILTLAGFALVLLAVGAAVWVRLGTLEDLLLLLHARRSGRAPPLIVTQATKSSHW